MKILIVDDDDITREIIENILQIDSYVLRTAINGRVGLSVFNEFNPDLVITDIEMPDMNGLGLLAAIRKKNADTIVLVATAHGSEEYALQALQLHANDYIKKPIDSNLLLLRVQQYAASISAKQKVREVSKFITSSELTMTFGNSYDLIYNIASYLANQAGGILAPEDLPMVQLGLAEMITNAIEHGNLGITYEMKSKALETIGGFSQLVAECMSDPQAIRRQVTVKSKINREWCEWVIQDEGEGFDWFSLSEELTAKTLMSQHGRGIMLGRLNFNEVEYSGSGNRVRVKRYVKPQASGTKFK